MDNASNGLGMTVLIYSRSRPLQQALQAMLGALGCPATPTAGTAEEASNVFAAQAVDAIILGRDSDAADLADTSLPIVDFTRPCRISELKSALISVHATPAASQSALATQAHA
ncbi:hypothetical protein [Hyphobacterium sp.]|uniref:hypothetical protein n=1 Tax=Hyphobacterium sp. TaxID=2004662 RepID=UPI003BAA9D5C